MDMAFNLMRQGEFENARDLLLPMQARIVSHGDEKFYIRWLTELGFTNYRLGDLDRAEELISSAIEKLELSEPDSSLPRAQNVLGLIHEKHAADPSRNRFHHLNEALKFYQAQLKSGQLIEKIMRLRKDSITAQG